MMIIIIIIIFIVIIIIFVIINIIVIVIIVANGFFLSTLSNWSGASLGIHATEDGVYEVPRLTKLLPLADYGCALAHREAWKAVANGHHEWVFILEDDTDLISKACFH